VPPTPHPADAEGDAAKRHVLLATNIAESSLTLPGLQVVIDLMLEKVVRWDARTQLQSLDLVRRVNLVSSLACLYSPFPPLPSPSLPPLPGLQPTCDVCG